MENVPKSRLRRAVKEWVQSARQECSQDKQLVKRLLPRLTPWSEALELRADGEVLIAQGRDICLNGIGFTCRYEFRRDKVVEIRRPGDEFWLPVVVRHCTGTVSGFKIGGRFLLD
jgi:hypothetical protein